LLLAILTQSQSVLVDRKLQEELALMELTQYLILSLQLEVEVVV